MSYNNICYNVTDRPTPDPHIRYVNGKFYFMFTADNRIPMWDARCLNDLVPPSGAACSAQLWAPELHCMRGLWYIYFSAADTKLGDKSHRIYVLRGPPAEMDPHGNSWEFMGPVRGLDQRQFAIDSTVIMIDGRHYLVYSAQSLDQIEHKESEPDQQLFIAPLFDPVTVASTPVMICRPDRPFERYRDRGFVEGPQWLESPDSFWQGIAYSCSANWTKESKINTLRFLGGSPLEPRSWHKSDVPLLQSGTHGPYGPGLGCFLNFKDSTVAFFHTTDNENDGASGRKCKMQRVRWTAGGPCMDQVVGPVTRDVALFTKAMNGFSAGVGTHAGQSSDLFVPMDVAQALVEEGSAAPRNTFLNIL